MRRQGFWQIHPAFDGIYVEGQRVYVKSLSAYARQFLERRFRRVSLLRGTGAFSGRNGPLVPADYWFIRDSRIVFT